MNNCPCCSGSLIRHVRNDGIYWFCPSCWQEMPNFSAKLPGGVDGSRLKLERWLEGAPLARMSGKPISVGSFCV